MSEASRQHRLRIENRLEELNAKYGPLPTVDASVDGDPSWGPLGTLAQRVMDPNEYARLIELDRLMILQERSVRDA